jgi:hypothetical protein
MPQSSEVAILDRLIDPARPTLSPDAAQSILRIEFKQEDRDRMTQLAEKAREGSLTADEQAEIDSYERIGHFLSLMKSKARVSLRSASHGS